MRKTLAAWLVVLALACFGTFVLAGGSLAQEEGTTVQGTQSSDGSQASTGEASGSNETTFEGGPSAEGSQDASASQSGSNNVTVSQSGTAQSGDPVAGAQVTGAVADNVTVQNQNSASGVRAVSGAATVMNSASAFLGPSATGDATGVAQAGQVGSNRLDVSQFSSAHSGDAVAGSQVTGIVGGGEHVVQGQNVATCEAFLLECALSGDATVTNTAGFTAGPHSGPSDPTDPEGSVDVSQAGQIGDNDAVISQSGHSRSGDALFGSQVAGIVGGSATVQNQGSSTSSNGFEEEGEGPFAPAARSGNASTSNGVGFVDEFGFAVVPATAGPRALNTDNTANAAQTGNNSVDVAQASSSASGDALSGSQVTGGVGDQWGFFTVQNQQASEDDSAVSGDAVAINSNAVAAGPDASLDVVPPDLTVESTYGREGAAGSVEGTVTVDGVTTTSAQHGGNAVTVGQATNATSGDALAGSQVTGGVGYTDVTVANQSSADAPGSTSGDVFAINESFAATGPSAGVDIIGAAVQGFIVTDPLLCPEGNGGCVCPEGAGTCPPDESAHATLTIDVSVDVSDVTTQASQVGDNNTSHEQSVSAHSGDALAGSQVTGAVAGDDANVTVSNQNHATDPDSTSGTTGAVNAAFVLAGPDAGVRVTGGLVEGNWVGAFARDVELCMDNPCSTDANADATATLDIDASVTIDGVTTQAAQTGNNDLVASQNLDAASGDAVAGGQVTGVVAGSGADVVVSGQSAGDGASARTGDTLTANEMTAVAGPFGGVLAFGSVVAGNTAVAGADATASSVSSCSSEEEECTADAAAASDADATATIGIEASVSVAGVSTQASQNGDNVLTAAQDHDAASGDAVAGAQVTGVVAGDGSDVTTQAQNAFDDTSASSGAVIAFNGSSLNAGPFALVGANGSGVFNNTAVSIADATAAAVATCSGDNTCTANADADATSDAVSTMDIAADTSASDMSTQASQNGDNVLTATQDHDAASGDAVAGAQVTGVVAGADSVVATQAQNASAGATSSSGFVAADNLGSHISGPGADVEVFGAFVAGNAAFANAFATTTAVAECSAPDCTETADADAVANADATVEISAVSSVENVSAQAAQNGDNVLVSDQDLGAASGDAVSGSQVTGIVTGMGSDATVQNSNAGGDAAPEATTGSVSANQDLLGTSGPAANVVGFGGFVVDNFAAAQAIPSAFCDPASEECTATGNAGAAVTAVVSFAVDGASLQASQNGDNTLDAAQALRAASGDAVAGSQVTGVVTGDASNVVVQNSNTASGARASSGSASGTNSLDATLGPSASTLLVDGLADNQAFASASCDDCTESSEVSQTNDFSATGVTAQSSQTGDNVATYSQTADVSSGDAVAGSQVTGVAGGWRISADARATVTTLQVANNDTDSIGTSGTSAARNVAGGSLSASATAPEGRASASQNGDSDVDGAQWLRSDTGDAVSGSQVSGSVAAGVPGEGVLPEPTAAAA